MCSKPSSRCSQSRKFKASGLPGVPMSTKAYGSVIIVDMFFCLIVTRSLGVNVESVGKTHGE